MKDRLIPSLIAVSAALFGIGLAADVEFAIIARVVGSVALIGLIIEWRLRRLPRSTEAAYLLGRADGHREGYEEGRRARLTVVPISRDDADSGGTWPASDRRRPGSPMRTLPDAVESATCTGDGVGSLS